MKRSLLIALAVVLAVVGIGSAAVIGGGLAKPEPTATPTLVALPEPTPVAVKSPASTAQPIPDPTPTTATAEPTTPGSVEPIEPTEQTELAVSESPDGQIAQVQQVLTERGYYIGSTDGEVGSGTASAVMAFQKVHGLVADGVVGPNTLEALADPVTPTLRGGAANRIEVDLDKQVLYVVQGGNLERVLPISSGSGSGYDNPSGGSAKSLTPVGSFEVERHIEGVREAPLGTLYDPMYFYGGWAIHGSNSVPAYPASHGCVRVTRADAKWLFNRAPVGTNVEVYGNTNAFSPAAGESAGTSQPAGDTADTTPDDGIQSEQPVPAPTAPPSEPSSAPPPPPPASAPPEPPVTQPPPSQPPPPVAVPAEPDPTTPAPVPPEPPQPDPSQPDPSQPDPAPTAGNQPPPPQPAEVGPAVAPPQ